MRPGTWSPEPETFLIWDRLGASAPTDLSLTHSLITNKT